MRAECLNSKWAFDEALPVSRLVAAVSESESSHPRLAPSHHLLPYRHRRDRPLTAPCATPLRHARTHPTSTHVLTELHRCTQFWGRRPFGVGLLVAGYDVSL